MVNVEYTHYECLVKKSRLPPNSDVEVVENRTYPKYIPGGDEEAVMGGPWEVHTPLCLWLVLSLSISLSLSLNLTLFLSPDLLRRNVGGIGTAIRFLVRFCHMVDGVRGFR